MASRSSMVPMPPPIGHAPKPITGTDGPSRPSWRCCTLSVPHARYQPAPVVRAPVLAGLAGTEQSATSAETGRRRHNRWASPRFYGALRTCPRGLVSAAKLACLLLPTEERSTILLG